MPLTSKELVRLLSKHEFVKVGQTGSHLKMTNPKTKKTVIIPMHAKDLKVGLERKILKEAGIEEKDE